MMIFHNATVDCDKDTAKVYEWALGEEDGDGNPTNPIKFPLGGTTIQHFGGRAQISIPRPGKAALILDRIKASEPQQSTNKGQTVYLLSGSSEHLYMQGIGPEDGQVSFTITEWSAGEGTVTE